MKIELYEPRNIVKENASLYRESEERRIDFENYHNWLYSHHSRKIVTPKNTTKSDLEAFNDYIRRVNLGTAETTV